MRSGLPSHCDLAGRATTLQECMSFAYLTHRKYFTYHWFENPLLMQFDHIVETALQPLRFIVRYTKHIEAYQGLRHIHKLDRMIETKTK